MGVPVPDQLRDDLPLGHAGEATMSSPPQDTLQHWVHAREEDQPGLTVYRPAGYPLPPARGRTEFELRPDGEAVYYGIGPTDRTETIRGRWAFEAPAQLQIELPGSRFGNLSMEIVSVEPTRLAVKQLP